MCAKTRLSKNLELQIKNAKLGVAASLLIMLSVLITSCTSIGHKEYYSGNQGLTLKFESLPSKFYYYEDENLEIPIIVKLENKGASHAIGSVFLYGFNPQILSVQGMEDLLESSSINTSCSFSFNIFGSTQSPNAGLSLNCGFFSGRFFVDQYSNYLASLSAWFRPGFGIDIMPFQQGSEAGILLNTPWSDIDLDDLKNMMLPFALVSAVAWTRLYGKVFAIPGNLPETPGGGSQEVIFNAYLNSFPKGTDKVSFDLWARACYTYASYNAIDVCINPYHYEAESACKPEETIHVKPPGGPVGVSKVEQYTSRHKVTFVIHIKNFRHKGKSKSRTGSKGRVWDLRSFSKCSPYYNGMVTGQDYNTVFLAVARLASDPKPLDCKPSRWIRLDPDTGEGRVTCTYSLSQVPRSGYPDVLVLQLWYGYQQDIAKRLTIYKPS